MVLNKRFISFKNVLIILTLSFYGAIGYSKAFKSFNFISANLLLTSLKTNEFKINCLIYVDVTNKICLASHVITILQRDWPKELKQRLRLNNRKQKVAKNISTPNHKKLFIDSFEGKIISSYPNENDSSSVYIEGEATVSKNIGYLTAVIKDKNGFNVNTVNYKWLADGELISDTTQSFYKLTGKETGKNITLEVSYSDNDGFIEKAVSNENNNIYVPSDNKSLTVNVTESRFGAAGQSTVNTPFITQYPRRIIMLPV